MKSIRKLLQDKSKPLVIPGVYDAIGAKIAEKVGFEAMFQTGYRTSATPFGMPDYGFIGSTETVDNARRICRAVSVPVIVDADTGYGNALSVWKLVSELENAGASGIFLEDQRWPKRCGHMQGKEVVTKEEYTEKLQAALDARSDKNFIIVARTDARATEGLENAIERGLYYKKVGADVIFDYKDDVAKKIYSDTDGLGVDVSIETVGAYSAEINTLTDAVQLTKKGGQIGVVGGFRVPVEFNFLEPYIKGQSLTFPICYNYIDGKHDFDIAIDVYKKSEIDISRIITGNYNFNDIETAFEHVISDREKVIKVHLTL